MNMDEDKNDFLNKSKNTIEILAKIKNSIHIITI